MDDDSLSKMSSDLQKRYQSRMEGTRRSLDTPRDSTRPATVEGAVQAQDALINGERERFGLEKDRGEFLLQSRGTRNDQDVKRYGGMMDANTQHATTILDTLGGQDKDMRASQAGMHGRNIDYLSGRDDKVMNLANRELELQNRQITMDMISRLLTTGAILFG